MLGQLTAEQIVQAASETYAAAGGGSVGAAAVAEAAAAYGLTATDLATAFTTAYDGAAWTPDAQAAINYIATRTDLAPEPPAPAPAPQPVPAPTVSTRPSTAEIVNAANYTFWGAGAGVDGLNAVAALAQVNGLTFDDVIDAYRQTGGSTWTEFAVIVQRLTGRNLGVPMPMPPVTALPPPTVAPPIQQIPRSPLTEVPVVRSTRRVTLTAPQIVTAINRAYELGGGGDPGVTAAMRTAERAGIPWQEVVNAFRTADGGAGWSAFEAIVTRSTGTAPVPTVAAPPLAAAAPGMPGWLIPAALAALSFLR